MEITIDPLGDLSSHRENCRLCLSVLFSFAKNVKIEENIHLMITELNIQFIHSNRYSKFICSQCHQNLLHLSTFRKEILEKQRILGSFLCRIKDEFILEDFKFSGEKDYEEIKVEPDFEVVVIKTEKVDDGEKLFSQIRKHKSITTDHLAFANQSFERTTELFGLTNDLNDTRWVREFQSGASGNRKHNNSSTKTSQITQTGRANSVPVSCPHCGKVMKLASLHHHIEQVHLNKKNYFCDLCGQGTYLKHALRSHVRTHIPKCFRERSYRCKICPRAYFTNEHLSEHTRKSHRTGNKDHLYTNCPHCKKKLMRTSLVGHVERVHFKKKRFFCDFCGQGNYLKHTLKTHVLSHIPKSFRERSHECKICPKAYFTKEHLWEHTKKSHGGDIKNRSYVSCPHCRKLLKSSSLVSHIHQVHYNKKVHYCDVCGKGFFSKYTMRTHVETHLSKSFRGRNHECKFCARTFLTNEHLCNHIKSTHGSGSLSNQAHSNAKKYVCDYCGQEWNKKYTMHSHIITHIPKCSRERIFKCQECPKAYYRSTHLRDHIRYCHENDDKIWSCHCGKVFRKQNLLYQHRTKMHNNKTDSRICEHCGKMFKDNTQLLEHVQIFHTEGGRGNHVCPTCGKRYDKSCTLKVHLKTHLEKTIACDAPGCDKMFSTRSNLKLHKRNVHYKAEDLKCQYEECRKAFGTKQKLLRHVKITHEKYRQQCPVEGCKFQVGRREYMKNHLKKHTELQPEIIDEMIDNLKTLAFY